MTSFEPVQHLVYHSAMEHSLTLLASGTPIPDVRRWGSSAVVTLGDEHLMFDCGYSATFKLHQAGMKSTDVDRLFLTHHHSDHIADYPALLLSRFDMSIGTTNPLLVYGPSHTQLLTDRLIGEDQGAFWPDIVARTSHPLSLGAYERRTGQLPRDVPRVEATDLTPGDTVEGENWLVRTAEVKHVQPYLDSLAYRLEASGRCIVFAGDTVACETLIELAADADVLVMDCVQCSIDMSEDPAYSTYISGSIEAGVAAQAAGAKHLVLVHQHPAMNSDEKKEMALEDVSGVFDGIVTWGEEGMVIPW
jgi:ribonuclease Z